MDLNSCPVFSAPPIHKQLPPIRFSYPLPAQKSGGNAVTSAAVAAKQRLRLRKNNWRIGCGGGGLVEEDDSCELVSGTELTIGDGIEAYLFKAVKNNNATGILLLSDIFGFEDEFTRDFAYRVACGGYNVLVPDLFNGDPWSKDRPKTLLPQWISEQRPERVVETVVESAKWMINEFEAVGISNKLGIIGFCYGGGRVVDILAQDLGTYFGSGVSFYGTGIDSAAASNVKVPLLAITGENDALCPISVLDDMSKRNKEIKMMVFKGRGHGFAHRPQTPEEDADAEEAFTMMRDWLSAGLLVQV